MFRTLKSLFLLGILAMLAAGGWLWWFAHAPLHLGAPAVEKIAHCVGDVDNDTFSENLGTASVTAWERRPRCGSLGPFGGRDEREPRQKGRRVRSAKAHKKN